MTVIQDFPIFFNLIPHQSKSKAYHLTSQNYILSQP